MRRGPAFPEKMRICVTSPGVHELADERCRISKGGTSPTNRCNGRLNPDRARPRAGRRQPPVSAGIDGIPKNTAEYRDYGLIAIPTRWRCRSPITKHDSGHAGRRDATRSRADHVARRRQLLSLHPQHHRRRPTSADNVADERSNNRRDSSCRTAQSHIC